MLDERIIQFCCDGGELPESCCTPRFVLSESRCCPGYNSTLTTCILPMTIPIAHRLMDRPGAENGVAYRPSNIFSIIRLEWLRWGRYLSFKEGLVSF